MKELSIEDKAKRYDEAITKGKQILNTPYTAHWDIMKEVVEHLLPELNVVEDERIIRWIRKELEAGYLTDNMVNNVMADKAFDWLKKQGEHTNFRNKIQIGDKVTRNDNGELVNLSQLQRVAKPNDNVEPKFKVGDWVVHNIASFIFQVVSVGSYGYEVINRENYKKIISSNNEDKYHLWTIQDAKEGDVLVDDFPFIFKRINLHQHSCAYCGISVYGFQVKSDADSDEWTWSQDIKPATKEQRDLLFKKMHEAGYVWDAEKKELKKIDQNFILNEIQPKQIIPEKPAWSEEDEINRDLVYNALNQVYDMAQNKNLSDWINNRILFIQNTWKPSEEQMEALGAVVADAKYKNDISTSGYKPYTHLYTLLQDLKKL